MGAGKTVALIGLHTLERIGIRSLLAERNGITAASYASQEEYRDIGEQADGFIVSAGVFMHNLDFYMPRRNNTLVVDRERKELEEKAASQSPGNPAGADRFIYQDSDETEIAGRLDGLIGRLTETDDSQGELSAREKEVLRLLVAGKINKEIADELCISINTVITHRKNITSKTGIKSVSGLSLYALMNGLA